MLFQHGAFAKKLSRVFSWFNIMLMLKFILYPFCVIVRAIHLKIVSIFIIPIDHSGLRHHIEYTYNIQYSFKSMYSVWPYPKIINIICNNELIIACPCPTSWLICWKWKQKCNYCWWIWSFSTNIFFQSIFMGFVSLSFSPSFWVVNIEHRPKCLFIPVSYI